jgi:DNA-binding protein HU-beta
MNLKELADAVVMDYEDVSKTFARQFLQDAVAVITEELARGEEVSITGLGKLHIVDRAARTGVNPRTKEKIAIPAKKAIKFKVSKTLKDNVL